MTTTTMTRDGIEFVDFRNALNLQWRGQEDNWELVGTITLDFDCVKVEYHQHAADTTEHTIAAGVYPVIMYYCRCSNGYRLGCPMAATRSVYQQNIVRPAPEIYWPTWDVYQIAEKAETGEIELADGWTVKSETKPSEYSSTGFYTHRWFEHNGERVQFKGV